MTKDCLKTKIWAKSPIATKLSHFNCQGRPCPSGGPLGATFWLKIENLCGNHILWTFCILWGKKFCYSFFRLYLLKIGQFKTILTQTCFKSSNERVQTKMVQNPIQNWFLNHFCKYQLLIQPKTSLGQNSLKLANFQ